MTAREGMVYARVEWSEQNYPYTQDTEWPAARLPEVGDQLTVYTHSGRASLRVVSLAWEVLPPVSGGWPAVVLVIRGE